MDSVTAGTNVTLSSNAGSITVNDLTAGGNLTMTAGAAGTSHSITLANATVGGDTILAAGNTITANSNIDLTGAVSAYGESGAADYAQLVNVTDNTGDLVINALATANGTLEATASNSDITATSVIINNGTVDFITTKHITLTNSTINGTDTLRMNSTDDGNIRLIGNTMSSLLGSNNPAVGTGGIRFGTGAGNVTFSGNTVTSTATIGTSGTPFAGNIAGGGNTFAGATNFHVVQGINNITLTTSDFQSGSNNFTGTDVTLSDNNGGFTISSVTATNLTATTTQVAGAGDLTINNANVSNASDLSAGDTILASGSNVNFGSLTAVAQNNIYITESTPVTIFNITNNSPDGVTTVVSTGGSVTGRGTGANDVISLGTGTVTLSATGAATSYVSAKVNTGGNLVALADGTNATTGDSIYLYGNVGGNLTATSSTSGSTPGHLTLGEWETSRELNIDGTSTFQSAADVYGYGTFSGALSGNGDRVTWWQVGATDLALGNVNVTGTATAANEFWTGYDNIANFYVPDAAIVDDGDAGGVDLTAANSNITIWAGEDSTNTTSHIRLGLSTNQDVYLWAAGDTNGTTAGGNSINIQTGNIGGDIVAVDETWDKTTGNINITLNSGDLTTKDIGTAGNVTLIAYNGSVLQNNAYGFDRDITVYATGDATIQAGDNGADTGSYINTGVYVQGDTIFRAAGKNASNDSVIAVGRIDGDTSVTNHAGIATPGDVFLGININDPNILNEPGVMDTFGDVTINALGDVNLNGGIALNGALTVTGDKVIIRQDIGLTRIASINATSDVDIYNYANTGIFGDGVGTDITAGGNILLRAGNAYPSDNYAHINSLSVNTPGNLTIYVAGDNNGLTPAGVSVNITGSVGGTSTAYNESGGAPRGSVTMP